jgi:hypothetical protein
MQNNNIFEFLDWVLKKKEKEPIYENNISTYIINRWLSMSDLDAAKIINVSTNRWDTQQEDSDNFLNNCKFYKTLLPKIHKKIEYIKRKDLKSQEDFEKELEENLLIKEYEISKRELKIYNNLLDNIKTKDK